MSYTVHTVRKKDRTMKYILFILFFAGMAFALVGVGLAGAGSISNEMIAASSTGFGVMIFTGYMLWDKKA